MIRHLTVAAALLLVVPACRQEDERPPAEAPVAEEPAAPAPTEAPAHPTPQRRERATIETGEPPSEARDRPPAAELVPTTEEMTPPLKTGVEVDRAQAARHFLTGTWLRALQAADADAFQALLSRQFRAYDPADESADVSGADWAAKRRPALQEGMEVSVSPPRLVVPDETPARATLRFHERAEGEDLCVESERALELIQEGDADDANGGWRVMSEETLSQSDCRAAEPAAVAAAHEKLSRAVATDDEDAIREVVAEAVALWDEGLQVETYGTTDLLEGDGRWLLDIVDDVEADEESSRSLGRVGWVDGPAGAFVYEVREGGPRLIGLARQAPD